MQRHLKYVNSVTDAEFNDSDNESRIKNDDNHEWPIQHQNFNKVTNIKLTNATNGYKHHKSIFLNKIENIESAGNEETSCLSALLADNEYSPLKLINPNSDTDKTSEIAYFDDNKIQEKSKKITYTITDLVKLEPINLYQIFDSIEDDGDLLITDVIFHEKAFNQNSEISQFENELTKMRLNLISSSLDSVSKQIELIRFIASSVGIQKQDNSKVFLFSYGILIEQLIEFHLISRMKDETSIFVLNALTEVIIKYCLICWIYETYEHLDIQFKKWQLKPFVPSKVKVYKYVVALLLTGYKTNLLGEVLVFFTTPPTPHILHPILVESESSHKLPAATKELIQYLRRRLMVEHVKCCGDSNEGKRWEFNSVSVPSINILESDNSTKAFNLENINDKKRIIKEKSNPQKSIIESECDRFPGSLSDYFKF